jgi:hypothetical protein
METGRTSVPNFALPSSMSFVSLKNHPAALISPHARALRAKQPDDLHEKRA